MSVRVLPTDKRTALATEHGANLSNWMVLANDRSNITGELPKLAKPKLDANGMTKTQARYKTRQDGKHNPPAHQRVSTNPRAVNRAETCSTCGALRATILFHNTQYHAAHCVPFVGSVARTR